MKISLEVESDEFEKHIKKALTKLLEEKGIMRFVRSTIDAEHRRYMDKHDVANTLRVTSSQIALSKIRIEKLEEDFKQRKK